MNEQVLSWAERTKVQRVLKAMLTNIQENKDIGHGQAHETSKEEYEYEQFMKHHQEEMSGLQHIT